MKYTQILSNSLHNSLAHTLVLPLSLILSVFLSLLPFSLFLSLSLHSRDTNKCTKKTIKKNPWIHYSYSGNKNYVLVGHSRYDLGIRDEKIWWWYIFLYEKCARQFSKFSFWNNIRNTCYKLFSNVKLCIILVYIIEVIYSRLIFFLEARCGVDGTKCYL